MAGLGGAYGISTPLAPKSHQRPNGRVLVFRLGGTAKLPAYTPPFMPAQPPAGTWPASVVQKGEILYAGNCGLCHGPSTFSNGVLPDLRRSSVVANTDAWNSVLTGGALADRGMISFSKFLKPEEIDAIRAYIASQSRALQAREGKAPPASNN